MKRFWSDPWWWIGAAIALLSAAVTSQLGLLSEATPSPGALIGLRVVSLAGLGLVLWSIRRRLPQA